jgi:GT2 family glycosyltransferase
MRPTVVIPTLDARELLTRALESLKHQTLVPRVVVVDNASTDGTVERVHDRFPDVRVVVNEENLGFGRAVNSVALELDGDVLVLVNNDVVCEPEFIERICAPFTDPEVGMVAGVLIQGRSPNRIDSAGLVFDETLRSWDYLWNEPVDALDRDLAEPAGPCGGAAAYRLSVYQRLGGFDETLFAYWEDVDLTIRVRQSGLRCALAKDARAEHHHGATLGPASSTHRRLDAFGRGYLLVKYDVRHGPVLRLKVAATDWPVLLVHLVVRRDPGPIRERLRGFRAGRRLTHREGTPRRLVSVTFGETLRRQFGFLRLRLGRRLPAHFYERGPAAEDGAVSTPGADAPRRPTART